MNTNTTPTCRVPARRVPETEYDEVMVELPPAVRDYPLFDAPLCLDPVAIKASLDRGFGLTEIKAVVARDTRDVYGKDYPK